MNVNIALNLLRRFVFWELVVVVSLVCPWTAIAEEPPEVLQKWLQPQQWERDTDGPILSLGESGDFDDTHLFAPSVARLEDEYYLWYSGSTGKVKERVFHLGLATSKDGRSFTKSNPNPVYQFGDGKHSIMTTTFLRKNDGTPIKEDGKLRMWFSSTDFTNPSGFHGLYESFSDDGIHWSDPNGPLLEAVYAPTILKEGDQYRMWYTDVSADPWCIRAAESHDGRAWDVHPKPVLEVSAKWEKSRLFYPCVMQTEGVYLMWYGSYWSDRPQTTAIGMAASVDGYTWFRNPDNPVLRPDSTRSWESHYTTSQSVIRDADGRFRIWYASRRQPPFVNKYFAINTAKWSGPEPLKSNSGTDGK
ncbi:hypothetical protein Pla110_02410 [Polystyrenella longa]|uniref:Glycosyl hydrolases family 43 n=1 Tax=Polystyrenella longa TaxID=2528007 RepID=A0A518CH33_9PLAN|nr:hypothetical protein [Polystyrenella longa]QDU78537.1 hypothetical protein Pla110_02410 [Polystyrenella longa]